VAANPLVARNDPPTVCNSGNLTCCKQTQKASDPATASLLGLLDIAVDAVVGVLVGLDCNPITVIGVGSTTCQQETVCCTGNNFNTGTGNSLINIDCSPINIIV
ncbi:hydrophobin, partial [Flammula alnicola]